MSSPLTAGREDTARFILSDPTAYDQDVLCAALELYGTAQRQAGDVLAQAGYQAHARALFNRARRAEQIGVELGIITPRRPGRPGRP